MAYQHMKDWGEAATVRGMFVSIKTSFAGTALRDGQSQKKIGMSTIQGIKKSYRAR